MAKRRTVLWLNDSDYAYLSTVSSNDSDTKNRSIHVLFKWLQQHGVTSFRKLDARLTDREANDAVAASATNVERRYRPSIREVA